MPITDSAISVGFVGSREHGLSISLVAGNMTQRRLDAYCYFATGLCLALPCIWNSGTGQTGTMALWHYGPMALWHWWSHVVLFLDVVDCGFA